MGARWVQNIRALLVGLRGSDLRLRDADAACCRIPDPARLVGGFATGHEDYVPDGDYITAHWYSKVSMKLQST